jgi:dihydrofolate reductase
MPRRLRYSVAMSLDGFIAAEDGGYDWIPMDDEIDFGAYVAKIDTYVMGRHTYELVQSQPDTDFGWADKAKYVVSTTLDPAAVAEDFTLVAEGVEDFLRDLKTHDGKDIWLFGGGVLFRSLLEAGLVDRVEVGVIPVLLGSGIPLLPGLDGIARLELHSVEEFPKSGIVLMKYDVAKD